ncbi:MAG: 50S ribosomal protein L3 [Bacteroidia bacterium]|jgi:large subunit ribosomal protein L3|nr:50S ribosomal protein L3 [Bacteroidia bacterium]
MNGLIGKKLGMTSIFDANGKRVACTVIQAGPCVVTQVKNDSNDGYNAVQIAFGDKKQRKVNSAEKGHFSKANTDAKTEVVEIRDWSGDVQLGTVIDASLFEEGEFVDIVGTSKGKGFQGVVKRHGFSGVGESTHGQHNRLRAPGSIGACSFPARVFKGTRMAGRTGGSRVKSQNLAILKIDTEKNLVVVKGSIPGHNGSTVLIEK